ncbi:MAG: hypothetical protein IPM36_21485 [Lewinellaceae bacterium]|nr:hypothetical protein [Lewinellaceae bacterium]
MDLRSYSSPYKVLLDYKNCKIAEGENGFSTITIDDYPLTSFNINLTLLYSNNKLGAVLVDVNNENAELFELKYSGVSSINIEYSKDIGPCSQATDIYKTSKTTCFKWFDMRVMGQHFN